MFEPITTNPPDPIFAAIEAHRKAVANRHAGEDGAVDDEQYSDRDAEELDTLKELFETPPSTIEGLIAFFRYAQTPLPKSSQSKTVIGDFVEKCVNGDENKWSAPRWAQMMELALRRIAAA